LRAASITCSSVVSTFWALLTGMLWDVIYDLLFCDCTIAGLFGEGIEELCTSIGSCSSAGVAGFGLYLTFYFAMVNRILKFITYR